MDLVQGLEMPTEVLLQGGAIPDVRTVGVFEVAQLLDQGLFDILLDHGRRKGLAQGKGGCEVGICASVWGRLAETINGSCIQTVLQRKTSIIYQALLDSIRRQGGGIPRRWWSGGWGSL